MALKYLVAEQQQNQFYFKVLMDDTKVNVDGSPMDDYVIDYYWTLNPPVGQTQQQYLDQIKVEISALVSYELNQKTLSQQVQQAPIPLAGF